jgi:glucose dehydrogenase
MSWATGWLRRLIWIDLIGVMFLPVGIANAEDGPLFWLVGLAFWALRLVAFLLGLSVVRTLLGPMPRRSLPDLIGVAALLALLATIMVLASAGVA